MYTDIVHWNGSCFMLGDIPVRRPEDVPRSWDLNNNVYYLTSTLHKVPIERIAQYFLGEGDKLFGESVGNYIGIAIQLSDPNSTRRGKYTILHPKIMNIPDRHQKLPTTLNAALEDKIAQYFSADIMNVSTSLAGTAMNIFNADYNGEEHTQLDKKFEKQHIFDGNINPYDMSLEELIQYAEDKGFEIPEDKTYSKDDCISHLFEDVFTPPLGSLPHRWREMAHAAVHGGPICCLRGGSDHAVEVDIKGAYLTAMCGEMPVIGNYEDPDTGQMSFNSYFAGRDGVTWEQIMADGIEHGFIDATVYVNEDLEYGMPPLPISVGEGMVFPRGKFRGIWTLPLLKMAVDFNEAQVLKVHHSFFSRRAEQLFLPYASFLRRLPKPISKELYVKFWGKFNFRGGWVGIKQAEAPDRPCIPANGLWWYEERINQTDRARPTYRPDIAAYIASYNHIALYKAMRSIDPKSIIAVHVDAIWTDDLEGARRLCDNSKKVNEFNIQENRLETVSDYGGWVIKREGPLRFWACGVYDHNGKLGYSGFDAKKYSTTGKPTRSEIDNWMKVRDNNKQERENLCCREWKDGITPGQDENAISKSVILDEINPTCPFGGLDFYDTDWIPSGWLRSQADSIPDQDTTELVNELQQNGDT